MGSRTWQKSHIFHTVASRWTTAKTSFSRFRSNCDSHRLILAGIIGDSYKDTVKIKWPNDIYFGDRKIAGILIENSLGMSGQILQTIAGIGININQQTFSDSIPNPISVRNIIGSDLDLDTLMPRISRSVTAFVDSLAPIIASGTSLTDFESMYHSWLWRADGFYNWRDTASGEIFSAKN